MKFEVAEIRLAIQICQYPNSNFPHYTNVEFSVASKTVMFRFLGFVDSQSMPSDCLTLTHVIVDYCQAATRYADIVYIVYIKNMPKKYECFFVAYMSCFSLFDRAREMYAAFSRKIFSVLHETHLLDLSVNFL